MRINMHASRQPLHSLALAIGLIGLSLTACSDKPTTSWSGYAEGDYVMVAAPLAGRLNTLNVLAGQQVAAGAPLFTLDNELEQATQSEAQARAAAASAQARNTDSGKRPDEIAVIQAQLVQAKAQAALTHSNLLRQQGLVAQGFLSKASLDSLQSADALANARVKELTAALEVGHLPAREAERSAARATADAAQDVLKQADWRTRQKQQTAPSAALVADTFFRPGEYVGAGQPVVSLLPPANIKARFFVPESALAAVQPGQNVTLSCDGCGAPITARISRIATQAEYTPPVIYSNTQRAKLVFMVEARPSAADAVRLKPGQPLDVQPAAKP